MGAAVLGFTVAFVLVAGSTQIELAWLSAAQMALGVYFAVLAGFAGWQAARAK